MHDIALTGYTVRVGRGLLATLGELVAQSVRAHRYAIITDTNVGPRYAARACASLGAECTSVFTMPAGEAHKTRETWASLTDAMLAAALARDTAVIALGGGVVGDVAGFVTATYLRGVPVVQVPTSLLAMLDASVGGKTGVDTPAGKNLVGAFHPPLLVVADPDVLDTLDVAHRRAGLAEALKHGVIASATHFGDVVHQSRDIVSRGASEAGDLIANSVRIKADIVCRDEHEAGVRKVLNFGHTLGHAIELLSGFRLLHGEAVAIGMVLESRVAEQMGVADAGTADAIRDGVRQLGLPAAIPAGQSVDAILRATRGDKKVRAGVVEYALPARIGTMAGADTGWSIAVADDVVRAALA